MLDVDDVEAAPPVTGVDRDAVSFRSDRVFGAVDLADASCIDGDDVGNVRSERRDPPLIALGNTEGSSRTGPGRLQDRISAE